MQRSAARQSGASEDPRVLKFFAPRFPLIPRVLLPRLFKLKLIAVVIVVIIYVF